MVIVGEIADAMINGELCECCGMYIEGDAPGYPRYCSEQCARDRKAEYIPAAEDARPKQSKTTFRARMESEIKTLEQEKVPCPVCKKKVKRVGLPNHTKDAHPGAKP